MTRHEDQRPRPGCPLTLVAWGWCAVAVLNLALALLAPHPGATTPLSLLRALTAMGALPLPGLAALLLILRVRQGRRGGAPDTVGAFWLVACSVGLGLVVTFALVVAWRLVGNVELFEPSPLVGLALDLLRVPVTPFGLSALAALAAVPAAALGGALRQVRVQAEPGLGGWPLRLALAGSVIMAVAGHQRLLRPMDRLVSMDEPTLAQLRHAPLRFDPSRTRLTLQTGGVPLGPGHTLALSRRVRYALSHQGEAGDTARMTLLVTAPPGAGVQVWRVACAGGQDQRAGMLSRATVPTEIMGHDVTEVLLRSNMLHRTAVRLRPGCLEVRLSGPGVPAMVELRDLSSQDLSAGATPDGRFSMLVPESAECHVSDEWYRGTMLYRNHIIPNLLLWGYFLSFSVETLAGGLYPALGLLFLALSLLSFCAAQVLLGACLPAPGSGRAARWARFLLIGPLLSHQASLIFIRTQSFAFPDGPYTFYLMGALALLVRRERWGFILLGCLAGFTRYPGGYVMALALFAWLWFNREDRPWIRGTLLRALGAGLAVAAALVIYYQLGPGLGYFLDAIYFETFPEHFQVYTSGPPAWMRSLYFLIKLVALGCFTMFLWPAARSPVARLLMAVTVGYGVTMISVHLAHSHYFQPLIYTSACAGLAGLAALPAGPRLTRAAMMVLVGALLSQPLANGVALVLELRILGVG